MVIKNITKMTTCSSIVKSTGKQCTNTAKFRLGDDVYCGTHTPVPQRTETNLIVAETNSVVAKKKITTESIHTELYEAIKRRIESSDPSISLDSTETERILAVGKYDPLRFTIVMSRAIELAGSSEDIPKIVENLFCALMEYSDTLNQKRIKIEKELVPWCIEESVMFSPRLGNPHIFLDETGYCIEYQEYGIRIINCRSQYIRAEGYENFSAWLADEKNIYMGPAHIVSERRGISLVQVPEEASPWYIELPKNIRLRSTHNTLMVKKILEDITAGKDDADRYLDLMDKTLGCVCMPHPCHCQVYVQVIRELEKLDNQKREENAEGLEI
jgi:hypothetical protein